MGRKRKSGHKGQKPDEHFVAGPFEFARFGRFITSRFNATQEQWEEAKRRMATSHPRIVKEIDALVSSIASQVARLPPDRLMHRAWWEFAAVVIGVRGPANDADQAAAMRMIDYVQAVIASIQPTIPYADEVTEDDWTNLSADTKNLFKRLNLEYQMSLTAIRQQQNPTLDLELEEFRYRAETIWVNVRGERFQPHETQALSELITPHSDILFKLFGIDADTLVGELDKILRKLTRGGIEAFAEMKKLQEEAQTRLPELMVETGITDIDLLYTKFFEDPHVAARHKKAAGEIAGMDLFDVEMITDLPGSLLAELTWSPGEDTEFFAPGEFSGWPVRIWPTMKRPFLRLDGRILCFDMFALFDNFYRVLQRTIFRLAPDYKAAWNERQKGVSEQLPFDYLKRLLPGAIVLKPVYYKWKAGSGPPQWHEADGLLMYDDHLMVIEVKAGAFTYTSPATDLPAHIASLENLVRNPARQGARFIAYLESAPEVSVADLGHREIARIRRADFRHVTICALTLDSFTELAARAQHLKKVGVDVGSQPTWVLSIDDLRVYSDLFDNPLTFLHFVEQRMRAAQSELVDLNDEMDHLGLYLEQNNYSQFADELVAANPGHLGFDSFRAPIQKFYAAVVREENPKLPRQEMPERLMQIIEFLGRSSKEGRAEIVGFLLDADGQYRDEIAAAIERQLQENVELGRPRPLSSHGEHGFTLFVWSPSLPRDEGLVSRYSPAALAAANETSRLIVELEFAEEGDLLDVHWRHIGLAGMSERAIREARAAGEALRHQRVAIARSKGKIGVNEQCPCGSSKKYKRCHGRPGARAF